MLTVHILYQKVLLGGQLQGQAWQSGAASEDSAGEGGGVAYSMQSLNRAEPSHTDPVSSFSKLNQLSGSQTSCCPAHAMTCTAQFLAAPGACDHQDSRSIQTHSNCGVQCMWNRVRVSTWYCHSVTVPAPVTTSNHSSLQASPEGCRTCTMLQALLEYRAPSHNATNHTAVHAKTCSDSALAMVQPRTSDYVQTDYATSSARQQAAHNSQLDFTSTHNRSF